MIYHLSNNPKSDRRGWCTMSRLRMANEIGFAKRTVISIVNAAEKRGFVEKSKGFNGVRTTKKWYSIVVYNQDEIGEDVAPTSVKTLHRVGEDVAPSPVKMLHQNGAETAPNINSNNSNINNNKKESARAQNFDDKYDLENMEKMIVSKVLKSQILKEGWAMKFKKEINGRSLEKIAGEYAIWHISKFEDMDDESMFRKIKRSGAAKFQAEFSKSWLPNLHRFKKDAILPSNVLPSRKKKTKTL